MILPVLMRSAYILAQVCIFIGIVIFQQHLIEYMYFARGIKIVPLSIFWTKMFPLKPIKTDICNKMMQFLLTDFHYVGKA